MEISLKAYGKINLGLDVVRRREDGYHEVKMIMQTVDLWDELTFCDVTTDEIVITSDSSELPDVKVTSYDKAVPDDEGYIWNRQGCSCNRG